MKSGTGTKIKARNAKMDTAQSLELPEFAGMAYAELRRIAGRYFKNERSNHTLQPTALVHEVYIRLFQDGPDVYDSRAHFFAIAARVMRRILVEHARSHNSDKRGGLITKVSIDSLDIPVQDVPDYIAIDSALERLAAKDARLAQIAELRVFAGLSTQEAADVIELAPSTVRALWARARVWLEKELQTL